MITVNLISKQETSQSTEQVTTDVTKDYQQENIQCFQK